MTDADLRKAFKIAKEQLLLLEALVTLCENIEIMKEEIKDLREQNDKYHQARISNPKEKRTTTKNS